MKKYSGIIYPVILLVFIFSACRDYYDEFDSYEPGSNPGPAIRFITDSGYVYQNSVVNLGVEFKVGINAGQDPTTGKDIIKVILQRDNGNITVFDTTLSSPEFTYTWDLTAQIDEGTEKFIFIVYDKGRELSQEELIISTKNLDPVIYLNDSTGYVHSDTSLATDETFHVAVIANSSIISEAPLNNIIITRNNGAETVVDTTINTTSFSYIYEFITTSVAGLEVFSFKVTDENGETGELAITVTALN